MERGHAEVGGGVDGDDPGAARAASASICVDPGVGQGRAHEGHPGQAVDAEVADVGAPTLQQVGVFDTADAGYREVSRA